MFLLNLNHLFFSWLVPLNLRHWNGYLCMSLYHSMYAVCMCTIFRDNKISIPCSVHKQREHSWTEQYNALCFEQWEWPVLHTQAAKNFHWTFVLFIWFHIFAFLVLFRFYAMLFRLQFCNDRNVNAWIQQGKNSCVRVLYLLEETILTVSRLVQSKKCVQSIIISSLIE